MLAALRAAGAVPPGHALETLVVPPRLTPALLRRVLAAIEALPEPVVLVLDDFHHAACPEVASTVDDLLRYRLPSTSWSSRASTRSCGCSACVRRAR